MIIRWLCLVSLSACLFINNYSHHDSNYLSEAISPVGEITVTSDASNNLLDQKGSILNVSPIPILSFHTSIAIGGLSINESGLQPHLVTIFYQSSYLGQFLP